MLGSKDQPRWPSVNSSAGNHAVGLGGGCFLESRWQGDLGHVINIVDRATAINPNRSSNPTVRINLGGPINPPRESTPLCRSTRTRRGGLFAQSLDVVQDPAVDTVDQEI